MARGLIWFPLLGLIIWLTWRGWKEYQKVEGYRIWSEKFDKAKYDIYAVLGYKDNIITWGEPTPQGIKNLETFFLQDVENIRLVVGDKVKDWNDSVNEGKAFLEFQLVESQKPIKIPFTDSTLASKWGKYLLNKK